MKTQPKALFLLNFVSMWECFSYYGMRVLLVLYMVGELGYSDEKAFGMYALYITLVELGGVIGGIAADRYLGLKRAIVLGGITIVLGHVCMTLPDSQMLFILGLGLIVAGTGLFRSNVTALLGEFYDKNDPQRAAGYTLFYTGINIGGFLASVACGIVGEVYGWHAGFGLAALGMLSGLVVLYFGRAILGTKGELEKPAKSATKIGTLGLGFAAPLAAAMIYYYREVAPIVPAAIGGLLYYVYSQIKKTSLETKAGYKRLGIYLVFLVLYYGCEEQLGSSLVLFAERHVDRGTPFGIIPAASLVTCNPLTILAIGPLFSGLLRKLPLTGFTKIGISFLMLGGAFCVLYIGTLLADQGQEVPLAYAMSSIVLISLGELLIGPTVFATASEVAPKALSGLIMGAVSLGYSLANMFSGLLSQMMTVTDSMQSLEVYKSGFGAIATGAFALSALLFIITTRKKVYST